jgi:hypothetical protein
LACAAATAAEPPATLTLLEGQAALLRGTSRYTLAEGVRLQTGDILELGAKGVVQVEFADGAILSLGPGARFYVGLLTARSPRSDGVSEFYLLGGWSKFASRKEAAPFRYSTLAFALWVADATAVVRLGEGRADIFVETGEVRLAEGFGKASPGSPIQLRGGEYLGRKGDEPAAIQPRPAQDFVLAMPRPYMDNLPARGAKYKDRVTVPQPSGELAYADVELWLKAPREIRRSVMRRFVQEARDPAFREALIANLRFHPEWDPILFPEKYQPKPAPPPAAEQPRPAQPAPPPARPAQASPPAPLPPVTVEDAGPGRAPRP